MPTLVIGPIVIAQLVKLEDDYIIKQWQKGICTHTCRWEHQGGEGASWEACHQAEAQQWGGQASSGLALAALVPLGLQ